MGRSPGSSANGPGCSQELGSSRSFRVMWFCLINILTQMSSLTHLNLTITAHTTWSSLNPAFLRYSTSHSNIGLGLLLTTEINYSDSSTTSERALGRHTAYYPSSHGASLGLCYPLSHVVSTWCWVPAQRLNSRRLARIPLRASRNLSRTTRRRQMTAHCLLTRLFAPWEDPATSQIRETGIKLQASRGL